MKVIDFTNLIRPMAIEHMLAIDIRYWAVQPPSTLSMVPVV